MVALADFVICRPGFGQLMVTTTGLESTLPLLSALTWPMLVSGPQGPLAPVDTLMVMDVVAPAARLPSAQVTSWPALPQPAGVIAPIVRPVGMVSVTTAFVAAALPVLATSSV